MWEESVGYRINDDQTREPACWAKALIMVACFMRTRV